MNIVEETKAFHNDAEMRDYLISRADAHQVADEYIKGTYGINDRKNGSFKGCSIACTLYDLQLRDKKLYPTDDHSLLAKLVGIPKELLLLQDQLFELLPDDERSGFTGRLYRAIQPGADLTDIARQFKLWLLTDENHGVIQYATDFPDVITAIERVAALLRDDGSEKEFRAAMSAASAASAAMSAAMSAARAAAESTAMSAASAARLAWSAARAVAESTAASAESAARSAAWSAAWSAESAARSAAWEAAWSARLAETEKSASIQANKLIELIESNND